MCALYVCTYVFMYVCMCVYNRCVYSGHEPAGVRCNTCHVLHCLGCRWYRDLSASAVSCGESKPACCYEGMLDQSIPPDVVSISAAMLACIEGGCWTTALQLFADMPSLTSTPDVLSSRLVNFKHLGCWSLGIIVIERHRLITKPCKASNPNPSPNEGIMLPGPVQYMTAPSGFGLHHGHLGIGGWRDVDSGNSASGRDGWL